MTKHQKVIRQRTEHNISRRDIDPDALKVLYRLVRRGHIAYLVGGGVRDLLLGRQPKDFDVSTNAQPKQIKSLFRNCFLIGRRFILAHIKYGNKIIETSTFRSTPKNDGDELLQKDDNSFGPPEEDALRRDFTINGLFYDIETFSVIDYVGGLNDLDKKLVRSIGEPHIRFQEDPVRMVRAVRFASRLNFDIEKETQQAIIDYHQELLKASEPRLLEEIYRLYPYGSSQLAFKHLHKTKLMSVLFPEIAEVLDADNKREANILWDYLHALDRGDLIVSEPSNALLLGALFFPIMLQRIGKPDSGVTRTLLVEQFEQIVEPFLQRLRVPKRLRENLSRILTIQHRFFVKGKKNFSRARFVAQEWFPEALALYELHLTASNKDFSRADEWRALWEEHLENDNNNTQEAEARPKKSRRRGRRGGRRNRKKTTTDQNIEVNQSSDNTSATPQQSEAQTDKPQDANSAQPENSEQTGATAAEDSEQKPKRKRRRRRRKKKSDNPENARQQTETPNVEKQTENTPAQPSAPISTMDILKPKENQEPSKKNKRKKRPRNKDKQILHDHRPKEVASSFDQDSHAPHWLDEI